MRAITPAGSDAGRSSLYRDLHAGRVQRIARGIYLPTSAPTVDWDQLEASTRRPEATICLTSALAHHDLTDAIPEALDVAIPRGTRAPRVDGSIRWHHFDGKTFELGRLELPLPGLDQAIGVYSAERTLVDCFRLRAVVGYETARDATREWLRRGGKPSSLIALASRLPRAKGPVIQALDMLA